MWVFEPDPTVERALCRGCHAPIVWATTKAGKSVPLNPGWTVVARETINEFELIDVPNEASHFATCEQREQFKRRKAA